MPGVWRYAEGERCWGAGRGGAGQYAEGKGAGGSDAVGPGSTRRANRQTPTQCLLGGNDIRDIVVLNAEGKETVLLRQR